MRSKLFNKIFICVFLIACIIPSAGMLIFGESAALANEVQSPKPVLINDDGSFNPNVLQELSDYFADRFSLRPQFITAWAKVNAALFHTSTEDQVLLGTDGWLYYSSTLDDYEGVSLTDEELDACALRLAEIQTDFALKGTQFIFTIAPNKNSLYPQNMPSGISNMHENSNAQRLIPYLEKYRVNYINLFDVLTDETETLYYSTDSHWTARGAAKAADALLSAAGFKTDYFNSGFKLEGIHKGDLYDMLYPAADGIEPQIVYSDDFVFECLDDPNSGNAITIETQNPSGRKSLYCWRDSFGIELYPFLADSFKTATFSRNSYYDASSLSDRYDVVIIELVERNIANLLDTGEKTARQETAAVTLGDSEELFKTAESFNGGSLQELIAEIGEPSGRDYATSCMGSGEDGELYYNGFTVYTYREGDEEKIVDVEKSSSAGSAGNTPVQNYELTDKTACFITDNLFFIGPELHCLDENGIEVIDGSAYGLDFDENGVETTGNKDLDTYVRQILADNIDPETMSQEDMLLTVYQYCVDNFTYRRKNYYDFGAEGWTADEALEMFSTGKGNCYNYAAAFCELARAIGYDAKTYSGTMGPDRRQHAWVEIEIDGETRLFDAEDDWTIAIHGELKKFNITLEQAERYKYIHA